MKKRRNRLLFMIGTGMCFGVLMAIVGEVFHIANHIMIYALLMAYAIFMLITTIHNYIVVSKFNNKVRKLTPMLMDEHDFEGYLTAYQKVIQETTDTGLKEVSRMNSTVAYIYMGEYEKANEILLSVNVAELVSTNKGMLYNNIAYNYFMSGEISKGCEVMEEHKREMDRCLRYDMVKPNVFTTFGLWRFQVGDGIGGFIYLNQALKSATHPCDRQMIQVIEARELIKREKTEQAREILQKLSRERTMPATAKEVQRLLYILNRSDDRDIMAPLLLPAPKEKTAKG